MNNTDLLFASLLGNNVVKQVPKFKLIQNEIGKHVLPVLPFPLWENQSEIDSTEFETIPGSYTADMPNLQEQFFPFSLSIDNGATYFTLPYEPMISISGHNNIVKRNVAKWHAEGSEQLFGTIKERWSQDDYSITITGALFGSILTGAVEDCFPVEDFRKLNAVLKHSKEVRVNCAPLELLGITKIVVEDFSFPFTKGENVQAYEVKVISDSSYNLLIKL
ncbi:hypothetical protein FNO01nite_30530 [Flavobacterium noncentrifugens]|uniref:DUF6046 domain-containing protein n=1 Tax=Flavobacterium noncentrifugens TaxID=1128970 RepID=A0A1G9BV88_9FLAO|nr:DUF6046 domain-containing protein [Flavobacterium noncentrifugens]GEP52381.1 hypothetical protein FNO01nite_30530 [Flavobacterium noncentrifugens]SDK43381.1 hypothetical protein SAMN04487935_3367 [Flavobacterium noncentrifugens]